MAAVLTRHTQPRPRLTIVPRPMARVVPLPPRIVAEPAPGRRLSKPVELPQLSRPQTVPTPVSAPQAERRAFAWIVLVVGYCALRLVF